MTPPRAAEWGTYRKKPVVIEAFLWNGHWASFWSWINALEPKSITPERRMPPFRTEPGDLLLIETLEGTMTASVGDWIIRGVQGEFYPCKPDIFDATYERDDAKAQP